MDTHKELFDRHFPTLFKYFAYRDCNRADCEDACQEVFMRFFTRYKPEEYDAVTQAKILYRIAKNVYREFVRDAVGHAHLELFDTDLPEEERWPTFLEEAESADGEAYKEQLMDAITQLSPNLRQVIELRFIEGLTRREVAERLNTKEKYVHIYQQRAIKALQKIVSPGT